MAQLISDSAAIQRTERLVRARRMHWPELGRWRLPALFGSLFIGLGFGLRIVLWMALGQRSGVTLGTVPKILFYGIWADLRIAIIILAPVSLYLWLVPNQLFRRLGHRALGWALAFCAFFAAGYLACVEFFFFEEFDSRFNLVAVDYLLYPHEVLTNIWDSYPVPATVAAIGLFAIICSWALRRYLRSGLSAIQSFKTRSRWAFGHLALLLLALVPLTSAAKPFSENRSAEQMASNGLASFAEALRTSELDYHQYYRTGEPTKLRERLVSEIGTSRTNIVPPGKERLGWLSPPRPGSQARKPNVVVLVEESFGAEFVGVYGNDTGLTPAFDELSKEGLLFSNAYATGTRTVRGLEAITASFPPIPSVSIVKRPGGDHVANWGGVMRSLGYDTSFLYGGYGYFDNMNQFFSGNGFEVKDRTDIEDQTFANIWGVCDEDLFRFAIQHFDQQQENGEPFFSIVLSTSNHKPFSFPEGIPGVPTEGGGRKAGIRYADHAIGRFFALAKERSWYQNTLFVVVADHGARVYGAAQIPLFSYEIPLLLIWPEGIEPGVVDRPISSMDLAPTVLGFLGQTYEAPFFGQDVMIRPPDHQPVLLFNHNHDVGALRGDRLVVLGLGQSVGTYNYQRRTNSFEEIPADGDLVELATAYYQTAFDLFRDGNYR